MRVLSTFLIATAGLLAAVDVDAYEVNINQGSEAVYLRVGDGNISGGWYSDEGVPQAGGAISRVSVSVPLAAVGDGTPQVMTANSRVTSDWDGYVFCNPGQLYVGGFYRYTNNGNVNANLTVTAPAFLVNGDGNTIPISDISWTSSGNGDGGNPQPVPGGTFQAGTSTLASDFRRNKWRESCLTFRYANTQLASGGTYTARVTYTLTAP